MAGRDGIRGNNQSRKATVRRRRVVAMGGAVGAFLAAAAMATGSAVTAAPAKADFEDLLDPIIQPILTSLTDSLAGFDPAAAVDVTSWTDSLLSSLNSIDLALPSTAESAAAAAASPAADPAPADATIPLTVLEGTEPTVQRLRRRRQLECPCSSTPAQAVSLSRIPTSGREISRRL